MSEKEKEVVGTDASATTEGRLYKPTVGRDAAEPPLDLRSKAPALPWTGTAENALKEKSEESSPDLTKRGFAKDISSTLTTVSSASEVIAMATIETDPRKQAGPAQPIPAAQSMSEVESRKSIKLEISEKESLEEASAEVVHPDAEAGHSGWSDEEQPGRLPRSHSLTSRFSTAVRQLFCCGVRAEAPSEDDISYHKHYAT